MRSCNYEALVLTCDVNRDYGNSKAIRAEEGLILELQVRGKIESKMNVTKQQPG